jgi:hypothetical protein
MTDTPVVDAFVARTVHTLNMRGEHLTWATITLDDTDGAGIVSILSDFGNWSNAWPSRNRGPRSLARFVAQIDDGYITGKMGAEDDFDTDATAANVRDHILHARRDHDSDRRGEWDADRAREEYDLVRAVLIPEGFESWQNQTTIADAWEFYHTVPNRAFTAFLRVFGGRMRAACRALDDKPATNACG